MDADPVELVRSGYNVISLDYRGDEDPAREYAPWLAGLQERVPQGGPVLDLGCGCGIPVARQLTAAGHRVTGVDISDVQIERARPLVPGADFRRADATDLDFPPGSFDAVVCLYTLIHLPLDRQPVLLRSEGIGFSFAVAEAGTGRSLGGIGLLLATRRSAAAAWTC